MGNLSLLSLDFFLDTLSQNEGEEEKLLVSTSSSRRLEQHTQPGLPCVCPPLQQESPQIHTNWVSVFKTFFIF